MLVVHEMALEILTLEGVLSHPVQTFLFCPKRKPERLQKVKDATPWLGVNWSPEEGEIHEQLHLTFKKAELGPAIGQAGKDAEKKKYKKTHLEGKALFDRIWQQRPVHFAGS